MIPALVALVAADAPSRRQLLEQALAAAGARDPDAWQTFIAGLPAFDRVPPLEAGVLVPERPGDELAARVLQSLTPEQLMPGFKSRADGLSVLAGLWQIHDYLDSSHELAQRADEAGPNTTAPYWHGIMHRREPDYGNARYWFRRVGRHPIFAELGRAAATWMAEHGLAGQAGFDRLVDRAGQWNALAFIDLCESCGRRRDGESRAAAELQAIEMRLLLEYSCRAALGISHFLSPPG